VKHPDYYDEDLGSKESSSNTDENSTKQIDCCAGFISKTITVILCYIV